MKIQQFLEHHGIVRNPFAEEDAQTDPVFKDYCIASTYHPSWDKVYGDPREPATSVVFGERGSGKTAMRLQIARHLREYNQQNPRQRVFIVHYDDFDPIRCSPNGSFGTIWTRSFR
jgi:pantothenate kinase-related protein Tda10